MSATSIPEMVFLLGCQRSGTTWLANIFDASPDSWFFMEPFSPDEGLFQELPHASVFLPESTPAFRRVLQDELPRRLLAHKNLLSANPAASVLSFRIEQAASRWIRRAGRFAGEEVRERARRFDLLNLNRRDSGAPICRKSATPSAWVIKELRLAGKLPLLVDAYPQARFVAIMRHPCATVHSIENWFARGRLVELKADLEGYVQRLAEQEIGREYKDLLQLAEGDTTRSLALYWRVTYETISRQLALHPGFELLVYEELASEPLAVSRRVLHQAGVPWSQKVRDYVERSSSTSVHDARGLTTLRDSRRYYGAWTEAVSNEQRSKVDEMTAGSELLAYFSPFYSAAENA